MYRGLGAVHSGCFEPISPWVSDAAGATAAGRATADECENGSHPPRISDATGDRCRGVRERFAPTLRFRCFAWKRTGCSPADTHDNDVPPHPTFPMLSYQRRFPIKDAFPPKAVVLEREVSRADSSAAAFPRTVSGHRYSTVSVVHDDAETRPLAGSACHSRGLAVRLSGDRTRNK